MIRLSGQMITNASSVLHQVDLALTEVVIADGFEHPLAGCAA